MCRCENVKMHLHIPTLPHFQINNNGKSSIKKRKGKRP